MKPLHENFLRTPLLAMICSCIATN